MGDPKWSTRKAQWGPHISTSVKHRPSQRRSQKSGGLVEPTVIAARTGLQSVHTFLGDDRHHHQSPLPDQPTTIATTRERLKVRPEFYLPRLGFNGLLSIRLTGQPEKEPDTHPPDRDRRTFPKNSLDSPMRLAV